VTLLGWLTDPPPDRGIRFAGAGGGWAYWSYLDLAELSRRVAGALAAAGLPAGARVSIVQRTGPALVGTFFGALAAGLVPSPLPPPAAFQSTAWYDEHVTNAMLVAGSAAVVTDPELVDRIRPLAGAARVLDARRLADAGPCVDPMRPAPTDLALVQFTSGTSGTAHGVRVPYAALEANIAAIRGWLAMSGADATASWLPVHHDMGLVGCLLTPIANGCDLWLMRPEQFVRWPLRYLRCFGADGARLTAMPAFGLSHLVRRIRPGHLHGLDFSQWRAVIVGAERLEPAVLDRFAALLAPYGLADTALRPAYGLAESTLVVTGLPLRERWRRAQGPGGQELVGCGYPLGGAEVAVEDPDGGPVVDGAVGEIAVRGPSVAAGGTLRTGDAGFRRDGQLYVLGRLGDGVKLRGRLLLAEDLESELGRIGGAPARLAVLLGERAGRPTVLAVAEQAAPEWLAAAPALLRRHAEGARVAVLDAPPGAIARTANGKPRRRAMWQKLTANDRRNIMTDSAISATAGGRRLADVRAAVRSIVTELAPGGNESADPDATLVDDLGYHSLALLELAFTLEDEFDLEPIEEATARRISTVRKVEEHVIEQLAARGEIAEPE
jgi:acyl carrier protein